MANRKQRADIARETVALLERESYTTAGTAVSLATELTSMRRGTTLYTPSDLESLVASLAPPASSNTVISRETELNVAVAVC